MANGNTGVTIPERDWENLSNYLMSVSSRHIDFVRQIPKTNLADPNNPPKNFHYTDLNGLNSIITTHDLWLTHALYCNDEAEMRLGIEVARNQIQLLKNENPNDIPKIDYLDTLDKLLAEPASQSVYICCFCEDVADRLSQWRAYGGNGSGVSITIDLSEFIAHGGNSPDFGFFAIWNVFYEKWQQVEIMKRVIDTTYKESTPIQSSAEVAKKAKNIIDFFVPTFKHEGFKEEQEWRMIFAPSPSSKLKLHYRAAHNMLIPYYKLNDLIVKDDENLKKTWRLPIKHVAVGPSRHRALNRTSVQSLLADNGYPDVEVSIADIPYRD